MMRRKTDKALVRVYSKDAESQGGWWHCAVYLEGTWRICSCRPDELEPIPQKRKLTVWVNVYRDGMCDGCNHRSRKDADQYVISKLHRIACLKFEREFEVGEGL